MSICMKEGVLNAQKKKNLANLVLLSSPEVPPLVASGARGVCTGRSPAHYMEGEEYLLT